MKYPVRAEIGITIQSLLPIRWAFWLKIGFTSLTPIHSGISCLFANTNNGTPCKASLAIILSEIKIMFSLTTTRLYTFGETLEINKT